MLKRSLMASGAALLLVVTLSSPVLGEQDGQADCIVPQSRMSDVEAEADVALRDVNHAIQAEVGRVLGAGKPKEHLADHLRRGLIGAVVDPGTRTVTIVTTPEFGGARGLQARLAEVAAATDKSAKAAVVTGCHSAAALIEAEEILIGRAWHPDAARAAFSFSLQGTDSRLHVSFDERYPQAAEALEASLGDRAIVTSGATGRTGRLDDGRPHFGGAGIRQGSGSKYSNTCTSAFSVRRNASDGQRGSVTAGHCFDNGVYVYSGPKYYGYTWGRAGFPSYDMIGIRSGSETYDNVIHTDPCCPSQRTVVGRHNAQVGDYVCFSGMVTKARCSIRVTSINGSFCDQWGCTSGLIEGIRGGEVIVRAGDSGAPIYVRTGSSSAVIAGMVIAGAGGGTIAYGEHIWVIESHLNVTLLTS